MPNKIKPSEVSEVLLKELQGIQDNLHYEEIGKVLQVSDGTARIYGLKNATANELLEFENGTMAIVFNLEEDNVGVVLLGASEGVKEGDTVKRTGRIASIEVSSEMIGRVIDPLGNPIDGGAPIGGENSRCLWTEKLPVSSTANPSMSHCKQV